MSADARRVIYEGNEDRNRRVEGYRREAWECGKREGIEQGRMEERERTKESLESTLRTARALSLNRLETVEYRDGFWAACNSFLAALES